MEYGVGTNQTSFDAGRSVGQSARKLKERERETAAQSARERKAQEAEAKMRILQEKYSTLINAFYEVAERKVSLRDDYGDEQWDALGKEVGRVLAKIGTAEGHKNVLEWKKYAFYIPEEYKRLSTFLAQSFKEQHKRKKTENLRAVDCSNMTGVEFEAHVSRILSQRGFTDIRFTPATNDQGADLLAKKDGRTIVVQTKRYSCPVGNSAVQEAISALKFYSGDEGWVVTNSTFTYSAKQLAQRAGIRLIDGHEFAGLSAGR